MLRSWCGLDKIHRSSDFAPFNSCLERSPRMIRKEFSIVAASEAGDYFQVLFEQEADNPETDYFLLQCQFEDPDDEGFYIESNDTQFCCGHVQVEAAVLNRRWLRLEMASTKWKSIEIAFTADEEIYAELARVLTTMFEDRLRHARHDA